MPAGEIPLKLPPPDLEDGLVDLRRLQREVRALRAIERAADRAARKAAATGRLMNALGGGLKAGIGGRSLAGLMGGSPHVIAVKVAAAALGRAGAAIMAQRDMPEVARLAASWERTTETAAKALFNLGAGQGRLLRGFAEDMTNALMGPIDAVSARLEMIALGKVRNMATTAGLERGGTRVGGRFQRGFAEGGAIFTLPSGQTFTEPQNRIVEDFKGVSEVEEESAFLEILARKQNERAHAQAVAGAQEVMARAVFNAREAIDDATKAAAKDLERAAADAAKPIRASIADAFATALTATEGLNEALALDVQMLQQAAGGSAGAARAVGYARLAAIGAEIVTRAVIAAAQGVAAAQAGDAVTAAAYFTAVGLYGAAGALAGRTVIGPPSREDPNGAVRRTIVQEAELVVVAPGYTDVEGLRRMIIQFVNADNPRPGETIILSPQHVEMPSLGDIVNAVGSHSKRRFQGDTIENLLNVVGLPGSAFRWVGGFSRKAGELWNDLSDSVGNLGKTGTKIGREAKRAGRRVGKEVKRAAKRFRKKLRKL